MSKNAFRPSIKGVSLKNIKDFIGREGPGYTTDILMNGEVAGRANNYGDGGTTDQDFISMEMKSRFDSIVKLYYEENPATLKDADYFTIELLELNDSYKKWKQGVKKGYPVLLEIFFIPRTASIEDHFKSDRESRSIQCVTATLAMDAIKKYKPVRHVIYENENDFTIK